MTEYEYEYIRSSKNCRIFSESNIFGQKYSNIFEYRIIQYIFEDFIVPDPPKIVKIDSLEKLFVTEYSDKIFEYPNIFGYRKSHEYEYEYIRSSKNCRIFSESNIFGPKYSNIFEYRIIRYTLWIRLQVSLLLQHIFQRLQVSLLWKNIILLSLVE